MTLHQAWMRQAESDLATARRIDNSNDPGSRCQAISKYQQCVEKSLKALLDKLHSAGLLGTGTDRSHKVSRYVGVLTRFQATSDSRDLLRQLNRVFNPVVVGQIALLDSFVPEYPAAGDLARRNHEYPFQRTLGDWRAPSDHDTFTLGEIKRIRVCAGILIPRLRKILNAFDRLYP